jgi:hypothetical protein
MMHLLISLHFLEEYVLLLAEVRVQADNQKLKGEVDNDLKRIVG